MQNLTIEEGKVIPNVIVNPENEVVNPEYDVFNTKATILKCLYLSTLLLKA